MYNYEKEKKYNNIKKVDFTISLINVYINKSSYKIPFCLYLSTQVLFSHVFNIYMSIH